MPAARQEITLPAGPDCSTRRPARAAVLSTFRRLVQQSRQFARLLDADLHGAVLPAAEARRGLTHGDEGGLPELPFQDMDLEHHARAEVSLGAHLADGAQHSRTHAR